MTPLNAITIILFVQIIGYIILDKLSLKVWKYLILGISLVAYIFVLPSYFIPDNPNNEPRCGMPALGITLAFWIFGCGATLFAHLIYILINRLNGKKNST